MKKNWKKKFVIWYDELQFERKKKLFVTISTIFHWAKAFFVHVFFRYSPINSIQYDVKYEKCNDDTTHSKMSVSLLIHFNNTQSINSNWSNSCCILYIFWPSQLNDVFKQEITPIVSCFFSLPDSPFFCSSCRFCYSNHIIHHEKKMRQKARKLDLA